MRKSNVLIYISFSFLLLLIQLSSCKREQLLKDSSAQLRFSLDTVMFDTVFTNMGTVSKRFKVYNPYKQQLEISSIQLAGGVGSDYNININGASVSKAENIVLPAEDSIYIYVNARIDPSNGDAIRMDSIQFLTNGNEQQVMLYAYGWNANYLGAPQSLIRITNATYKLTAGKPYILMGFLDVDTNATLIIEKGVELYMYGGPATSYFQRAQIRVLHNGYLEINKGGNLSDEPVKILSHRLEDDYKIIPFHHGGIYLGQESRGAVVEGCIIQNAVDAFFVDSLCEFGRCSTKLQLKNVDISNVARAGILSLEGSVKAENTIISNSNQFNVAAIRGGLYSFDHCTFVNYGVDLVSRNESILLYTNYLSDGQGGGYPCYSPTRADFSNCILYGTKSSEIVIDTLIGSQALSYTFQNCLAKINTTEDAYLTNLLDANNNNIINQDPEFIDIYSYDFRLDSLSPCKEKAIPGSLLLDAYNNPRLNQPDIGAIEALN